MGMQDWTPDQCRQVAELLDLDDELDDEQEALERLEHDDPVGFVWFADRPGWVEARLRRNAPQE
jgi:hypothetical protein